MKAAQQRCYLNEGIFFCCCNSGTKELLVNLFATTAGPTHQSHQHTSEDVHSFLTLKAATGDPLGFVVLSANCYEGKFLSFS